MAAPGEANKSFANDETDDIPLEDVYKNKFGLGNDVDGLQPKTDEAPARRRLSTFRDLVDDEAESTGCMRYVEQLQNVVAHIYTSNALIFKGLLGALLVIALHIFAGFAVNHNLYNALVLVVFMAIAWLAALYYLVAKPLLGGPANRLIYVPLHGILSAVWQNVAVQIVVYLLMAAAVGVYLYFDTMTNRVRLVSFGGLLFYILICFIGSTNPAKVKWRPVIWGLGLQFGMGLLVLRWPVGHLAFDFASREVVKFLDYAQNGTSFVYGFLVTPPNICGMFPVFTFTVLQTVIYFGAIVAVLYYYGIIQFILLRIAWLMQYTMGTTAAESLNAAACIFLGQTEAVLLIKPCLITMTESELHAVMTAGFACIAGSLFAAYISFGACPTYLLSATVMSAPASLAVGKLLMPETKKSKQKRLEDLEFPETEESNVLEAISTGAVSTIELVAAIVANLIVFLALLAFLDATIGWFSALVGHPGWTFERIIGYVFFPLAFVMGSSDAADPQRHTEETLLVAQLMGTKTVLNEFIAYQKLGQLVVEGRLGPRAQMMATYALCGFSNIGSIGIQLGILGGMCPERKSTFAKIAVRALVAGSVACFMTACVAGVLVVTPTPCEPQHSQAHCTAIP